MDSKKAKMIVTCNAFIDVISYFEGIRLNDSYQNEYLIELCKKDLIGIRSGEIITRPYNIQDEIVLGRIHEANEYDLLDLFNKKFQKAKELNGFKTHRAFAKYEYKYQKGIWDNNDIIEWIPIAKQWLRFLKNVGYSQLANIKKTTAKYYAKHYVLAYLIECKARNITPPIGRKMSLEKIGNERMGEGKGNTFYKKFNEIINEDLDSLEVLEELGGESWQEIIKDLSSVPEMVEEYLQNLGKK